MKHFIKLLFAAVALTAAVSSCTEKPADNLVLTPSAETFVADGTDSVTFTVKYGEEDVTTAAVIKVGGTAIEGNTFTTTTAGDYKFTAEYDGKTSSEVTVTATEPTDATSLVLSVDKNNIPANGTDSVVFTVKYGEEDVTTAAVIKVGGTAIEGNTFTTTTAGDYKFTAEYDGKTSNEVTVTATEASAEVSEVILNHETTTRAKNTTFTLKAVVLPENAISKEVTWTSSNTSVATVDANGVISALTSGRSTITVTTVEGGKIDECVLTVEKTCNSNVPGWGEGGPGEVSFKTEQTWTVGDRIWSDVVIASRCQKSSFKGAGSDKYNYNADCRNNPGYGDLFSWCAVIRFQDQLCPDGWRVPSLAEFQELDIAFGGEGGQRYTTLEELNNTYLSPSVWGGELGGNGADEQLYDQGVSASYWTATEYDQGNGYNLYITTTEDWGEPPVIQVDSYMSFADLPQSLRCIKTI